MYIRKCPKCQKDIKHKNKNSRDISINRKLNCRSCSKKKYKESERTLKRICLKCKDEINYSRLSDKINADKKQSLCKKCSLNNGKFKKNHELNNLYNNSSNSVSNLLKETPESFYWLGFVIADGSLISGKKNTFELSLSAKDLNHLKKFSKFINYNKEIKFKPQSNSYRINIHDRHSIFAVKEKYDIKNRKTYNPINFDLFINYNLDLLTCLLIGIIDGDGYVGINGKYGKIISIVSHKSWVVFFEKLFENINLNNDFKTYIVKKTNKVTYNLYKKNIIYFLYEKIKKHKLPILIRKWNKIL